MQQGNLILVILSSFLWMLYISISFFYSFLEKIHNGVLEYNVKFNPSKIQKNVSLWDKVKEITFLGWNIKFID